MDKIEKIKDWVKKQKKETLARNSIGVITGHTFFVDANELLSFLDTLPKEPDNDDLNEEIKKEMVKLPFFIRGKDQIAFARHFVEWGAEHFRDSTMMIDKSLKEEIETWIPAHISIRTDETLPINPTELAEICKEWGKCIARHFAEWQKSQMLKDAEECELYWDGDFLAIDLNMVALGYSEKDKVKVIVLKAEEE